MSRYRNTYQDRNLPYAPYYIRRKSPAYYAYRGLSNLSDYIRNRRQIKAAKIQSNIARLQNELNAAREIRQLRSQERQLTPATPYQQLRQYIDSRDERRAQALRNRVAKLQTILNERRQIKQLREQEQRLREELERA